MDAYNNFKPEEEKPEGHFRSKIEIPSGIFDINGREVKTKATKEKEAADLAKLKQRAQIQDMSKLSFDLTVDLQKTETGDVIFVMHIVTINKENNRIMTLLDYGWNLKSMINYVQQMQNYQRENWPEWAKEYYNFRSHCPDCYEAITSASTVGTVWEAQNPKQFIDKGLAECACGFKGIIHGLISKEKANGAAEAKKKEEDGRPGNEEPTEEAN